MRLQNKVILFLTAAYAMDANADGTGRALLEAAFYFYIMPIFLAIPLILISITDNNGEKKAPWVITSLVIGICSFYAPFWINKIWNYDFVAFIPFIIQVAPGYLHLFAFWITDAKREP